MLIIIYSIISLLILLILHRQIDYRKFYSTLLLMSYLRFLIQYILVYMLEVWEFQHLPLPMSNVIGVPILLDISIYPLLAYLFIRYMPEKRINQLIYYLVFPLSLLGIEASLIFAGYLEHLKEWNLLFSYYVALSVFLIVHWQYKLFLNTGWYTLKNN